MLHPLKSPKYLSLLKLEVTAALKVLKALIKGRTVSTQENNQNQRFPTLAWRQRQAKRQPQIRSKMIPCQLEKSQTLKLEDQELLDHQNSRKMRSMRKSKMVKTNLHQDSELCQPIKDLKHSMRMIMVRITSIPRDLSLIVPLLPRQKKWSNLSYFQRSTFGPHK